MVGEPTVYFSLDEAKKLPPPAIYEAVRYWEGNRSRGPLPVHKKEIISGFVLEYGNSSFKDYHSLIGINTGKAIRLVIDQRERVLSDEELKSLSPFFASLGKHVSSGKAVNQYVKDGDVYLLSVITRDGISKIPYYAPDLDQRAGNDDISLLRDLLSLEKRTRK